MEEMLSAVPREARPYQGQGAGLVTRAIASAVDAVTVVAALGVCYLGINAVVFVVNPRGFQFVTAPLILTLTTALIACVGYFTAAWSATGRSYGDHVMGLRVVDRQGRRLRVPRAVGRAVLCVVFPVGLLGCAVQASRRSVQDMLLGTSVVYDWAPRRAPVDSSTAG